MSKFFNSPTVGIDVSADFSFVAILAPNGDVFKKPFRIKHNVSGFTHLLKEIKKVEEEFKLAFSWSPQVCTTYLFSTFLIKTSITHLLSIHSLLSVTKMWI